MTHQIYTEQQLQAKSLAELKTIYSQIGATVEVADKRFLSEWIKAIVEHQASQVQSVAQAELEQHIEEQSYEVGYKVQDAVEVIETDGVRNVMINGELAGKYWHDDTRFGNSWVMIAGSEELTFAAPMQAENTITYNWRTNRQPMVQTQEIVSTVEIEKAIAVRTAGDEVKVILGSYEENLSHAEAFMSFYRKGEIEVVLTPVRYLHAYDYEMVFKGLPQHTIDSFRKTFGRGHNVLTAKRNIPQANVFETDVPNVYAVWSNGNRYTVTIHPDECTCSCPHYHYRHQEPEFRDKHIEAVKEAIDAGNIQPELVRDTKHSYLVNAPIDTQYLILNSSGDWQNPRDPGYTYSNSVDAMFQRNPIKIIANRLKVGDQLGYYRVDAIKSCPIAGVYGLHLELLPLDYQEIAVSDDIDIAFRQMDERKAHRQNNLRVIRCFEHEFITYKCDEAENV